MEMHRYSCTDAGADMHADKEMQSQRQECRVTHTQTFKTPRTDPHADLQMQILRHGQRYTESADQLTCRHKDLQICRLQIHRAAGKDTYKTPCNGEHTELEM